MYYFNANQPSKPWFEYDYSNVGKSQISLNPRQRQHFSSLGIHRHLLSKHHSSRMDYNLENNSNRQDHVDRDLKMISRWVKSELFKGCKFLYKGERELDPKGKIHTLFERMCVPTLEGMKVILANADDPPYTMELYKERIWALATKQRIVSNGLALRRSGVYTVMQNRFLGKPYYSLACMWG